MMVLTMVLSALGGQTTHRVSSMFPDKFGEHAMKLRWPARVNGKKDRKNTVKINAAVVSTDSYGGERF